eukprot:Seg4174.2 transcript_id=Seg4174.2/GoldUCD/mRNA.D3Y31 product="hypothetical protein" protein_id=Seg4174.2/GoldUCD/D3Y31
MQQGAVEEEATGDKQARGHIWGIKTPQMQLNKATQIQAVNERTLLIFENSVPDIMRCGRRVELERPRSQMEKYVVHLKGDNERFTQFMIETGHSVDEVTQNNYGNEIQMDTFKELMDDKASRLQKSTKGCKRSRLWKTKRKEQLIPRLLNYN